MNLTCFSISYMEPFLENHLIQFGFEIEQASLMFSLEIITYVPSLIICTYLPRKVDQRTLFIFGMFILIIA